MIKILLSHGGSANIVDTDNHWTPLHYCCGGGEKAAVLLLLNAGADIESRNKVNNNNKIAYIADSAE